jgi:hypothetical protein
MVFGEGPFGQVRGADKQGGGAVRELRKHCLGVHEARVLPHESVGECLEKSSELPEDASSVEVLAVQRQDEGTWPPASSRISLRKSRQAPGHVAGSAWRQSRRNQGGCRTDASPRLPAANNPSALRDQQLRHGQHRVEVQLWIRSARLR